MFEKIIENLQSSACGSVDLLAELAGLETYIAETYTQRCLTELLQNSDDSKATKVKIYKHRDSLIYLNNGELFTEDDFMSLCKNALSNKHRGQSIGYRGIGFKSVVNICNSVIVASGGLRCSFNRGRTLALLNTESSVPLIRVPHQLTHEEGVFAQSILNDNPEFTTCFIFEGLHKESLSQEIEALTDEHFLFLRNLLYIDIEVDNSSKAFPLQISRDDDLSHSTENLSISNVSLSGLDLESSSSWVIVSRDNASIAFINADGIPSRLSSERAFLHAYLPTQCLSGTGARMNSDFSTDPSRTRLKYDELTGLSIKCIASLVSHILHAFVDSKGASFWRCLIDAIIPYSNHKLLELQGNNFCGLYLQALSCQIKDSSLPLQAIPRVFNEIEHLAIDLSSELGIYSPVSCSYRDASRFWDAIGVPALPTSVVISIYQDKSKAIDPRFSPYLIKNLLDERVPADVIGSMYIFPTINNKSLRALDIISGPEGLDPGFARALSEKLMSYKRVQEFLLVVGFSSASVEALVPSLPKASSSTEIVESLDMSGDRLAELQPTKANVQTVFLNDEVKKRYGISDWRLAEELVAFHYRSQGFQVIDVSKANKGYDLEVFSGSEKLCVEIKKLGNPPTSFTLTQNEFNESLFKGSLYVMALVNSRGEDGVEIMFVHDPYNTLAAFTTKRAKAYEFFVSGFCFTPSVTYE